MPPFLKTLLTWGAVAFLIFFIAFRPDSAAQMFQAIGGGLMAIAHGFSDFFTGVVS